MPAALHVKSEWSLGLGTASVRSLAGGAARLGYDALALTDVEGLHAQIAFHHACREHGVRPITGLELRRGWGPRAHGERSGRVVLLARNRSGYETLCAIVSRRRASVPTTAPDDPVECLAGGAPGVFALTDDPDALSQLVRLDALDREALGALVVRPPADAVAAGLLLENARREGVRLVADLDAVIPDAESHVLHELLAAIRLRDTLAGVRSRGHTEAADRRLRSAAETEGLFGDLPEALTGAAHVSEACELDLRSSEAITPTLPSDGGNVPADARLERLCRAALQRGREGGRAWGPEYDERLARELATISTLGFAAYFLAVAEVVRCARSLAIPVAGRGSAAGSLVVHLLGATELDPLEHGLVFERFLNERRRDFPDVDLDVTSFRRDELLEQVARRFGPERVAMVSAHGTFQRRSAYREGLKALGMSRADVERVCRRIPPDDLPDHAAAPSEPLLEPAPPPPPLPPPFRVYRPLLEALIGRPQYVAVHPGGLVVADRPIHQRVPLERATKGVPVSQYDLRSLQHTGLLKIDLLGNHCLSEIAETLDAIRGSRSPEAHALAAAGAAAIPLDDLATLAALDRADTIGCFQFESPAMRALLAQLPIRSFADAVAALALVRPGAASGDAKRSFVRRAHGEESADPLLPALATRMAGTHGLPLYEEDVLLLLQALTGRPLAEADELRTAVVDAAGEVGRSAALSRGVRGWAGGVGVGGEEARRTWARVRTFAAYTFSKAHAAAYALLGYRAVFLRTHAPGAFGCAVLNHHGGLYPLRTIAAAVGRWGVALEPPSVNRSEAACTLEGEAPEVARVRIGLAKVKHLSTRTRETLLRARAQGGEFRTVADLVGRASPSRRELEALVLCGACDDLPPLDADGYPFAHETLVASLGGGRRGEWEPVVPSAAPRVLAEQDAARLAIYRRLVRARNELRYLEMHPSGHPLEVLRGEANRQGCVTLVEAGGRPGRIVRVAAVLAASRRVAARSGATMRFLTLEDETGTLEAVVFPRAYRALAAALEGPGPFLISGTVEDDHGARHVVVTGATPFHRRPRPYDGLNGRSARASRGAASAHCGAGDRGSAEDRR